MTTFSIRWINYFGDLDDYNEINVIGPYETREARNADLYRLQRLPGNDGNAEFEASDAGPDGADNHVIPDVIAQVATFREFVNAFFNLSPFSDNEPVDEVHPDQVSIHAALAEQTGSRR